MTKAVECRTWQCYRLKAFFHGKSVRSHGDAGRQEDDAPRLIVCGYSFLDENHNEVLLDGLRGNRNAQCFALMYSNLEDHPRVVEYAVKQGNLTVLAKDGAVIGTRAGRYRFGTSGGEEHKPWLYEETVTTTGLTEQPPRCRLVAFHYFGFSSNNLAVGAATMRTSPFSSDQSSLGTVENVNGSSVSVKLSESTPGGLLFVNGEAYRVGQVGGFVRIPSGYVDLFAVISMVGAGAALCVWRDPAAIAASGTGKFPIGRPGVFRGGLSSGYADSERLDAGSEYRSGSI